MLGLGSSFKVRVIIAGLQHQMTLTELLPTSKKVSVPVFTLKERHFSKTSV